MIARWLARLACLVGRHAWLAGRVGWSPMVIVRTCQRPGCLALDTGDADATVAMIIRTNYRLANGR